MPLVELSYTAGVLEGRAAGVEVISKNVADRALVGLSKNAMKTRVSKMMGSIQNAIKVYVHLQYETSGMGLTALSQKIGEIGGSMEPWAPLADSTRLARAKGHGYYQSKGSNDKPLLWTGLSRAIAKESVRKTDADVIVRVTHYATKFNEALRPVFVLSEIARLVKAVAKKSFEGLRKKFDSKTDSFSKEAAYDDEGAFGFRVGESRPFSGDKVGRPKGIKAGIAKLTRLISHKGKGKRKKAGGFSLRDIRSQIRQYKRDFGGSPDEGD